MLYASVRNDSSDAEQPPSEVDVPPPPTRRQYPGSVTVRGACRSRLVHWPKNGDMPHNSLTPVLPTGNVLINSIILHPNRVCEFNPRFIDFDCADSRRRIKWLQKALLLGSRPIYFGSRPQHHGSESISVFDDTTAGRHLEIAGSTIPSIWLGYSSKARPCYTRSRL